MINDGGEHTSKNPANLWVSRFQVSTAWSVLQGPDKRKEYNIKDNLVRFSCGVEDVEDIWNDLNQALEKALGSKHAPRSACPERNGGAIPLPALEPV